MKKLLFMMFLMVGTLSFANAGVEPNASKINKSDSAVGCCTVGEFRVCVGEYPCLSCSTLVM